MEGSKTVEEVKNMAFGDILKKAEGEIGSLGVDKLLGGDFLKKFTKFGSIQDLLTKVGVKKPEDLATVDQSKLDSTVKANSSFGSWKEMLGAAKDHLLKK